MKLFISILFFAFLLPISNYSKESIINNKVDKKNFCVTLGYHQGGGSLIGADLELYSKHYVGIHAGAGIRGLGFGFNVHFNEDVNSSFISLQYWNQNNEKIRREYLGGVICLRYYYFSIQYGLGYPLNHGPESVALPDISNMLAVGLYYPF
jgi:hypothetical protein